MKSRLIEALNPLCDHYTWMPSLIDYIRENVSQRFLNNFELFGIIRAICYQAIKDDPTLFTDPTVKATFLLKALATECNNNILVEKQELNIPKIAASLEMNRPRRSK